MEPRGSLLIPPDFNVGLTDWERARNLRSGNFDVLEMEPSEGGVSSSGRQQHGQQQTATKAAAASPRLSGSGSGSTSASFARYQKPMGEADLDDLRRRFEALLPADNDQQHIW